MNATEKNDAAWADWIAKSFAVSSAEKLQRIIERRDDPLTTYSWGALARAIQSEDLDDEVLDRWVSLLLSKIPEAPELSWELLDLGKYCVRRRLTHAAARIFDLMLTIRLSIENIDMPGLDLDYKDVRLEPVYGFQNPRYLWENSENSLKIHIGQFAELLVESLVKRLKERHFMLSKWKKADRYSDLSLRVMGDIESLSPGSLGLGGIESLTVCAARDCLDWVVENRREDGAFWRNRLSRSESPLLRALAAHSVRMDAHLSPDEKAAWLLETNPLLEVKRINDWAPHKEIYALAEQIYPSLNKERRRAMIEAIGEYRYLRPDREPNEELDERDRYEWYRLLLRSDPECPLAKEAFEEAQRKYPEWKPSSDTGGNQIRYGFPTPLTAEELLEKSGSEWIPELVERFIEESKGRHEDNWCSSLADAVSNAAKQNFEWSLELADALAKADEWDTDVWYGLIGGWYRSEGKAGTDLTEEQYRKALEWMKRGRLHGKIKIDNAIARTLQALVINGGTKYASELLAEANPVASALWEKLDKYNAGVLMEYWLGGLWIKFKESDSASSGLKKEEWRDAFEKVLEDSTKKGNNGKTALAREFSILLHLDEAWTIENLLPLFSSRNDAEFEAAWAGLLWPRMRFDEGTANALCDPTLMAIERILPNYNLRSSFIDFYTRMAEGFIEDPLEKWIPEFFKRSRLENRREFTRGLDNIIRLSYLHKQEAELGGMWNRWLKRYWERRLLGVPNPLDSQEIYKMYAWPAYFSANMPEAVELAVQMNPTEPKESLGSTVYFELEKPEIWSKHPKAVAKLLLHLSTVSHGPFDLNDMRSWGPRIIDKLLTCNLPDDMRRDLEDLRATLG